MPQFDVRQAVLLKSPGRDLATRRREDRVKAGNAYVPEITIYIQVRERYFAALSALYIPFIGNNMPAQTTGETHEQNHHRHCGPRRNVRIRRPGIGSPKRKTIRLFRPTSSARFVI